MAARFVERRALSLRTNDNNSEQPTTQRRHTVSSSKRTPSHRRHRRRRTSSAHIDTCRHVSGVTAYRLTCVLRTRAICLVDKGCSFREEERLICGTVVEPDTVCTSNGVLVAWSLIFESADFFFLLVLHITDTICHPACPSDDYLGGPNT